MNFQNIHCDCSLGTRRKAVTLGNCVHFMESLLWDFHCHFLCGNLMKDKFEGVEAVLTFLGDAKNIPPVAKS